MGINGKKNNTQEFLHGDPAQLRTLYFNPFYCCSGSGILFRNQGIGTFYENYGRCIF